MKELINKRDGLVKQAEEMRTKLNDEKRTSFTADERSAFDKIKNEITELNARIADEQFIEAESRNEAAKVLKSKEERNVSTTFNLEKALRNFTTTGAIDSNDQDYMFEAAKADGVNLKRGQLYIPASVIQARAEKRAQTTSNSSAIGRVNQGSDLSFVPYPILYNKIGCRVYEGLQGGKLDLVSMANYSVSFGTENTTITDASLTPAKATLVPTPVNATASFSRELLNQSNPAIIDQILNTFMVVIDAAIDKTMFAQLSGLTQTITGASTYANILTLEAGTNAIPTAFVTSFRGRNYLKSKEKTTSGTVGNYIWGGTQGDQEVAGYAAFASPQANNGLYALGNFQDMAVGKWGGLVIIEDPYSNKRNNLVDYSVIQMADVKVVNSQSFAITNGGSYI